MFPKKVAIGTLKGGAGKTMLLYQIAGVLQAKGRVLLIDADPQANLSANCGVDSRVSSNMSLTSIFNDRDLAPDDVIIKSPMPQASNIDLIAAHMMLTISEMQLISRSGRELILDRWIKDNTSVLSKYDWILMDTNPSMGIVNQNIFTAADSVILVTDIDPNSLLGVQMFIDMWSDRCMDLRMKLNIETLVINNADARLAITKKVIDAIKTNSLLSGLLVDPPIRNRVALKNSATNCVPVSIAEPNSDASKDINCLVENLLAKEVL